MTEIVPVGYTKEAVLYRYQQLQIVDSATIGRLLYPDTEDPTRRVLKIYNRNKDKFTDRDTILLDVDTAYFWSPNRGTCGNNLLVHAPSSGRDMSGQIDHACQPSKFSTRRQKVRFFTLPYGVMKICKFSQSPFALQVMERMIELHDSYIRGTLPRWDKSLSSVAWLPKWYRGRGEMIKQLAQESGVSAITIRRRIEKMKRGEPLNKNLPGMKKGYVHRKHRDKYEEVFRLLNSGHSVKEAAEKTGVSLRTIYYWIKGGSHDFFNSFSKDSSFC